jgi:rhodanese-related sulfurtransferase
MADHISTQQARQQLQSGDAVLVDVRTPAEFSEVRAKAAINLPLDRLSKESLEKIAKGKRILFICRSGKRSEQALAQASSWGFTCDNIAGGTMAWEQDGFDVDRGGRAADFGCRQSVAIPPSAPGDAVGQDGTVV